MANHNKQPWNFSNLFGLTPNKKVNVPSGFDSMPDFGGEYLTGPNGIGEVNPNWDYGSNSKGVLGTGMSAGDAVDGIAALGNLYLGTEQIGLMKENLGLQKDQFAHNQDFDQANFAMAHADAVRARNMYMHNAKGTGMDASISGAPLPTFENMRYLTTNNTANT